MDSDRDSREQQIAALLGDARSTRKRPSRAMWIAAALVGVGCAVAFTIILVADGTPTRAPGEDHATGFGFGAGVLVGLAAGIAIGLAIARQRHSSRNSP